MIHTNVPFTIVLGKKGWKRGAGRLFKEPERHRKSEKNTRGWPSECALHLQREQADMFHRFIFFGRERADQRLQQRTNPTSRLQMGINATEFFYYSDYEERALVIPSVRVAEINFNQTIEVRPRKKSVKEKKV